MPDPAQALAAHVCRTRFTDLPAATVAATKRDLLDTLGCLLGGSGAPGIAEMLRLAVRWGGREECAVLLHDVRLPAPQAALLNTSMAHALDFDDTHDGAGSIHPGASVLGAVLAVAELQGSSGQDMVLAAALGLDVSCRMALAATVDRGWHRTAAIGVFGAAAAAGKLLGLGLGPAAMEHAFGIAYSHAAGNRQCIVDGALTKRLQAGLAASGGVYAAMLAQEGFTGASGVFAGQFGFYELYQPGGYDLVPLTEALGTAFRGEGVSFKPYPCGRPMHAALDAALALRAELGADEIASVHVAADAASYADQFEGGAHKRQPTQIVEAQFALPFLIATALLRGRVGIAEVADFDAADVVGLAARMTGEPRAGRPRGWAAVTVRLADGRSATREVLQPLGSPANPLSDAQLAGKFADCAGNAVRTVPAEVVAALVEMAGRLETLPRATDWTGSLRGSADRQRL